MAKKRNLCLESYYSVPNPITTTPISLALGIFAFLVLIWGWSLQSFSYVIRLSLSHLHESNIKDALQFYSYLELAHFGLELASSQWLVYTGPCSARRLNGNICTDLLYCTIITRNSWNHNQDLQSPVYFTSDTFILICGGGNLNNWEDRVWGLQFLIWTPIGL